MANAAPTPDMTAATSAVLAKVRRMIPPMLDKFHKGELLIASMHAGPSDDIY